MCCSSAEIFHQSGLLECLQQQAAADVMVACPLIVEKFDPKGNSNSSN